MHPLTIRRNVTQAARKAKGVCVECAGPMPTPRYARCEACREKRADAARGIDHAKPEPEPCSYAAKIPCRGCHKTFKSTDRRSVRLCDACRYHWFSEAVSEEFLYMT